MFAAFVKCSRPTFALDENCMRPLKMELKSKGKNQKSKLRKTIEQPQIPEG
jgi:hypothetical protein